MIPDDSIKSNCKYYCLTSPKDPDQDPYRRPAWPARLGHPTMPGRISFYIFGIISLTPVADYPLGGDGTSERWLLGHLSQVLDDRGPLDRESGDDDCPAA